jgi:hypothetical protein
MAQVKAQRATVAKPNPRDGRGVFINDKATIAAALAVNDTVDFLIPAGTEIPVGGVSYYATDMDTNGAPALAFKVGYKSVKGSTYDDDDYWSAARAIGQAVGGAHLYAPAITFEEDVYLRFTCTTIAATFAAGSLSASVDGNSVGPK